MDLVAFLFGFGFLAVASWHDIRTREVPDLVSYGLVLFAVSYGVAKALFLSSWLPLLSMLAGVAAGVALGLAMFYLGQWGGADSKLLIGLGGLLGLWLGAYDFFLFLVLALFAGAAYGVLYTAWLALRHKRLFVRRFKGFIREPRVHRLRAGVIVGCFLIFVSAFIFVDYQPFLFGATAAVYLFFYLWVGVKVVEQAILIKEYPVGKLTEGDWIQKDVFVRGKRVCGPKDLGISREQITELRRLKVKRVWVKEGVPFVPSFLIAYALLWLLAPYVTTLFSGFFG